MDTTPTRVSLQTGRNILTVTRGEASATVSIDRAGTRVYFKGTLLNPADGYPLTKASCAEALAPLLPAEDLAQARQTLDAAATDFARALRGVAKITRAAKGSEARVVRRMLHAYAVEYAGQ